MPATALVELLLAIFVNFVALVAGLMLLAFFAALTFFAMISTPYARLVGETAAPILCAISRLLLE